MNQALVTALPIIALILALILAGALWYWWSSGQSEPSQEEGSPPADASTSTAEPAGMAAELSARVGALVSGAASAIRHRRDFGSTAFHDAESIEVMRVLRDLSNGGLVIQVGERRYYTLGEMDDPQVRRRFLGNAEAIATFAQLKKGTSPLIDWSAPAASQTPLSSLSPMVEPPSAPPAQAKPAARAEKAEAEEPEAKSMADEIEEMLQYELALTPDFAHRSIHIRSAVDGSIYVEVDDQTFEGVGAVSDSAVQSFLQGVIREWESKK